MRVLKTKYLFRSLVSLFRPNVIFDVGSLDGSDALHFEKLNPKATIYAFEASACNFEKLRSNVTAVASRIICVSQAVGATDGMTDFLIWDDPTVGTEGANPGMHSTRPRADVVNGSQTRVTVPMCRLDTLAHKNDLRGTIAAWVDVEGASFEVLSGAHGIRDQIAFAHVEVETNEIWKGQKTEAHVLALAQTLGLTPVARGAHPAQRDIVFVSNGLANKYAWSLRILMSACAIQGPVTAAAIREYRNRCTG